MKKGRHYLISIIARDVIFEEITFPYVVGIKDNIDSWTAQSPSDFIILSQPLSGSPNLISTNDGIPHNKPTTEAQHHVDSCPVQQQLGEPSRNGPNQTRGLIPKQITPASDGLVSPCSPIQPNRGGSHAAPCSPTKGITLDNSSPSSGKDDNRPTDNVLDIFVPPIAPHIQNKNVVADLDGGLCRSTREKKVSTKFKDYICNTVWHSTKSSPLLLHPPSRKPQVSFCIPLKIM